MPDVIADYQSLETRLLGALRPDLTEAEFNDLALEVFQFQAAWNQPYASYCKTRPRPRTWRDLPAVPQVIFKRYALSCVPPEQIGKTFLTSGTTGEARGAHHFHNTRLYEAALLVGWRHVQRPRLRQLILTPNPEDAPQSSLAHMMQTLQSESDAAQTWCIDRDGRLKVDVICSALADAEKGEPVALLGTALAFLNLFEVLGSRRFRLTGSFAMETGGYKGSGRDIPKAELYGMFTEWLGLPPDAIWNEYGMTELSSQFYSYGLDRVHQGGPWVRALVIHPETNEEVAIGEVGVLRIFDLANLNSVLAIETRDLAVRREDGFALIGRDPGALPRGCSRMADEQLRS